jgi:hypothetical protein
MKFDRHTLEFVRTGLERYPDARETVNFFEETIHKLIVAALQQRKWRTFHPSKNNKGGLAITKTKGDAYLHAWLDGSTRRQSSVRSVYLGIYWEEPVIAAVGLFGEKWKKLPLKLPSAPNKGIKYNPFDHTLRLEVGKDFEPDVDFRRLLDPLEDAIEAAQDQ